MLCNELSNNLYNKYFFSVIIVSITLIYRFSIYNLQLLLEHFIEFIFVSIHGLDQGEIDCVF